MHTLGQFNAMGGAEQVKIAGIIPVMHDGEPVEQRNVMLLCHHAHII